MSITQEQNIGQNIEQILEQISEQIIESSIACSTNSTNEQLNKVLEQHNYTFIQTHPRGVVEVQCSVGHTFKRTSSNFIKDIIFCPVCKDNAKIDYIKSLGFTPISENLADYLEVKCFNGHIFKKPYNEFVTRTIKCQECIKNEKISWLHSLGFTPVSANLAAGLEVKCSEGHIFKRTFGSFSKGNILCPQCETNKKVEYLNSLGFTTNKMQDYIEVTCINGHTFSRFFSNFAKGNAKCPECEKDKKINFLNNLGYSVLSEDIVHNVELLCQNNHTFIRSYDNIIKGSTRCPICYPNNSSREVEILKFLEINDITFEQNKYNIISKELDFYIPEKSLAIEFNGIYWHSEKVGKTKDYHLSKTEECLDKGIQLIHIFENEWITPVKREIWKSIILKKLGKHTVIFSEETILKKVSREEERSFLDENHLQGSTNSEICLGLYKNEELLCLMSFGKSKSFSEVGWELLRFSSKKFLSIADGASKLFKYFLENYSRDKGIVSYSDRRYSRGNLYKQLGFKFSHNLEPNYFYFKGLKLENRQKYQKHKLKDILKDFDESLTEVENMKNNGFNRIWDCGSSVWVYK